MACDKVTELLEEIKKLSIMELKELVDVCQEAFGVSAACAVPVAASSGAGDNAGAASEKTSFDVVLKSFGSSKINVIKVVRELTGLSLPEAKAIVEGAPKEVKTGVEKAKAEEMKQKLEEAGATVELK